MAVRQAQMEQVQSVPAPPLRQGLTLRGLPLRRSLLQWGGAFLGGFLLSGLSLLGQNVPAALALTAALPFGLPAICSYAGSVLGYLLFWGLSLSVEPVAAGFLILAGLCLFTDLLPKERIWFMPAGAALLYGLIGFVGLLEKGFPLADTGLLLGKMLLLALLCIPFTQAMEGKRGPRLFLGLCVLAGCSAIRLPGGLPVSLFLATGISFLAATGGESLLFAAACGLALDVSWASGASMTAILAFSALVTKKAALQNRFARAGLFLVCQLAAMVLTGGAESLALLGALGGVALALCIPRALVQPFEEDVSAVPEARLREISRVSDVLLRVGQTLSRTRLESLQTQSAAVFDRAAEQACRGCSRWFVCWQSRATDTYHALSGVSARILRQGSATREDLPVAFTARCADVDGFLTAVNAALDDQLCRRQYQHRLSESRMVVASQYCTAARLLQRVAEPEPSILTLPAFHADLGYRSRGVRGDEITGDHGSCFTCGEWYYVLLCDGMGTGEEASRESATAIGILSDLIRAGLEAQDALETLNGVYILRGDGVFSTVDLLQLSLVTGEGYLLKWGAAPSYLKRPLGVEKLGITTLPPGLSAGEGGKAACIRVDLSQGETLVLVSDGADTPQTLRQIEASIDASPKELAAQIVACGEEDEDDRTAVVVRLKQRGA